MPALPYAAVGGARLRDMFPRGSVEEEVGKKRERNDCIEIA